METGQRTILIVEDDAAHAEAIRRALVSSDLKPEIVLVTTLREFHEKVAQSPPDIAIMDLNLPDGRAVEIMTSPPENGAFPILLMTSYGNERVAVEAIKSGAIDYIVKSAEAFAGMPRTVERALREWGLLADRKRAERDIRESEARFHTLSNQFNALLDTLPDRIILYDLDFRVTWANQAATSELSPEEVRSGETYCYTLWRNQAAPCDPCPAMKSLQSGASAIEVITTPDGKIWERRSIPVKEAGRIVSMIGLCRDITEHRRLEDQLCQAQKMDAVGRLAGGVAHDFNNMLNVILGYTELALERMVFDETTTAYLHGVLDAGQRSADLTRQLLAFSRKQVVEPRILDVNKSITNQMKLLKKLIVEDVQVKFVPGREVGPILMDPSQIDQILVNLMVNARDAIAGPGGITITTANVDLDEAYCRSHPEAEAVPGEYVRLCVSDTGCGMDAATLERIFEPFFTTKERGKGTGLGLATVYGIVKQNNGEIHAISTQGSGTTFVIHLPRLSGSQVTAPPDFSGILPRGSETILLVEDDEQNLKITRLLLEKCGYTVISSTSPVHACAVYGQHAADIAMLLSDVVMPQINGRELYEKIRILRPGLKVLFMSGYTDEIISHRGGISEGTNFIHKPFTRMKLAEKVRAVLDAA